MQTLLNLAATLAALLLTVFCWADMVRNIAGAYSLETAEGLGFVFRNTVVYAAMFVLVAVAVWL